MAHEDFDIEKWITDFHEMCIESEKRYERTKRIRATASQGAVLGVTMAGGAAHALGCGPSVTLGCMIAGTFAGAYAGKLLQCTVEKCCCYLKLRPAETFCFSKFDEVNPFANIENFPNARMQILEQ